MKCPYVVHRSGNVSTIYKYDDEGRVHVETTVENNCATFSECYKESCGAWDKTEARCVYGVMTK